MCLFLCMGHSSHLVLTYLFKKIISILYFEVSVSVIYNLSVSRLEEVDQQASINISFLSVPQLAKINNLEPTRWTFPRNFVSVPSGYSNKIKNVFLTPH